LIENCGGNIIRRVTELRAKYHELWSKVVEFCEFKFQLLLNKVILFQIKLK
jgi:hypothetical protein